MTQNINEKINALPFECGAKFGNNNEQTSEVSQDENNSMAFLRNMEQNFHEKVKPLSLQNDSNTSIDQPSDISQDMNDSLAHLRYIEQRINEKFKTWLLEITANNDNKPGSPQDENDKVAYLKNVEQKINEKVKIWLLQYAVNNDINNQQSPGSPQKLPNLNPVDPEPFYLEYDSDNLSFLNSSTVICSESWTPKKTRLPDNPPDGSNTFSCFHCGLSTNVRKYLKNHIKTEHLETCLKKIRRKTNSTSKKSFVRKDFKIISPRNVSQITKNNFKNSDYSITKERIYKCKFCTYCATTHGNLIIHQNAVHLGFKPFTCPSCSYRSVFSSHLKRHILAKHNNPLTKCGYCDYVSKNKKSIDVHRKKVHQVMRCDKCDYTACKEKNLKEHIMAKHLMIKPFKCDRCNYSTVKSRYLELHKLAKHDTECRPFVCKECDFTAITRRNLQLHVLSKHLKSKPFTCSECSYSSTTLGNLNRHLATHTNSKSHKNSSKGSTCKSNKCKLKVHSDIHIKIK